MRVRPSAHPGAVTLEINRLDTELLAQPEKEPLAIRKILVPVDFSPFSYKSIDYASAFALQSNAEILLLHVIPLNYVDAEFIAFDSAELEKQAAGAAKIHLEKLSSERIDSELTSHNRVAIGRSVEEIVKAAEEFEADLIIMSTHGYTGF